MPPHFIMDHNINLLPDSDSTSCISGHSSVQNHSTKLDENGTTVANGFIGNGDGPPDDGGVAGGIVTDPLTGSGDNVAESVPTRKVKCVLVGDGAVGKTSLIVSYTTNGYPMEYMPTAFDDYSVVVTVDNKPVQLQLCDTAGQDDFDALRPLCYPSTDIFLLCFSVVSPTSFTNVQDKWVPEIRRHAPHCPVMLVGTQCDLRNDVKVLIELDSYKDKPVSEDEAERLARDIGASHYMECSALTQKHLKGVFDQAILDSLNYTPPSPKPSGPRRSFRKKYRIQEEAPGSSADKPAGWRKFCCFS